MTNQICAVVNPDATQCTHDAVEKGVCAEHAHYYKGQNGEIGFNLIVKNEETVLEKCLSSIRPHCDEIVVTDTGSEDGTIPIALRYADKVLYHEWQNSFSEARNFSLQYSRAQMLGWIDAVEYLTPESQPLLRPMIKIALRRDIQTIFCPLHSELSDQRVSRHFLPKFFRRGTGHFEAIVHNQLIHSQPTAVEAITFWHTGYNLDDEKMDKKRKRTSGLLLKQLETKPDDVFAIMNLARCYMTGSEYKLSEEWVDKGLALPSCKGSIREMLLYNKAMCAMAEGEYEDVEKACWESLGINDSNLDMLFVLGWAYTNMGYQAQAIVIFNRYIQVHKGQGVGFNLLIVDFWSAFPQLYHFLTLNYRKLGIPEKALHYSVQAVIENEYNAHLWKQLCFDYLKAENEGSIVSTIHGAIDRGIADSAMLRELGRLNKPL